jgi:cytochrome c
MTPRPLTYLLTIALMIGAVTVAVISGRALTAAPSSPGLVAAAYSPGGTDYLVKRQPVGADGAAADCIVCHSVEKNGPARVAPNLWGIVGAPKARAEWFAYSAALRQAGGIWDTGSLDKFLADPHSYLPGTSKTILGVRDDKERRDVIAFLETLKD